MEKVADWPLPKLHGYCDIPLTPALVEELLRKKGAELTVLSCACSARFRQDGVGTFRSPPLLHIMCPTTAFLLHIMCRIVCVDYRGPT